MMRHTRSNFKVRASVELKEPQPAMLGFIDSAPVDRMSEPAAKNQGADAQASDRVTRSQKSKGNYAQRESDSKVFELLSSLDSNPMGLSGFSNHNKGKESHKRKASPSLTNAPVLIGSAESYKTNIISEANHPI